MAYNPKSKRTNPKGTPQQVKNLNGLTANKNIDDIRALSKISNGHGTSIDTLNSDVKIINGEISSLQKTKQDNIKLTTTGSSGPATLSGFKLNIPDYSSALSGYVPNSRTLTINGTTYDLSANRTWNVGTVTSIATTGPITGGTITGSGTIGITQATTSTDGYLSSTDWNTFNNKQNAITLTTVGSSGPATLIGSTLNIPNYNAALTGYVPNSRTLTINGTTYDLSANRTWSVGTVTAVTASAPLSSSGGTTPNITISQASGTDNGYLSSTDWTTFNNKQPAGNYITALSGEATGSGPGTASVTLNNASVTAKVLTGVNVTGGSINASDSILTAFGKLQNQINGLIGSSIYQGVWNASTNTPALTSGVGTRGYYYIVNVAGSTNLDGITDWNVGDWAIFDGTAWQQVDNTDSVTSVNGQTGAVSLTSDNIPEGVTNLYFTNLRARQALTLTTLGTSGAATYSNTTGILNIPQYQSVLTNPVTGTGTANYVARWTSSSEISTGVLYDNGTNVGIGTNNPASKLTLQASNNTYALELRNSLGDTRGGFFYDNTSGANTSLFMQSSIGTDVVVLRTSGTSYLNGGNVGIGTTNPIGKLSVDGGDFRFNYDNAATSYYAWFNHNSSQDGGILLSRDNSTLDWQITNGASGNLWFYAYGLGAVALTMQKSNGNVGIGTTAPSYKLHVVGTFTSTSDTILANAINSPIKNINNYPIFEGQGASAQFGFSRAGSGTVTYIGSDSTYLFRLWDGSFGANYFNVLQNGNIGIGTNSTSYKLDVAGDIHVQTSSLVGTVYFGNNAQNYLSYYNTDSYYRANGAHYFEGNGFYKGIWDGIGNLGIGNTNPTQLVDIGATGAFKTLRVRGTYNFDGSYLASAGANGGAKLELVAHSDFSTSASYRIQHNRDVTTALTFDFASPTTSYAGLSYVERMRIDVNGNVGIGITSPSAKLHVNGTFVSNALWTDNTSVGYWGAYSTAYGYLTWDTGFARIGAMPGNRLDFSTNGSTLAMTIATDGNIGIGTTGPNSLLSATERVLLIENSNLASLYLSSLSGRKWSMSSAGDGALVWWDLNSVAERMRINSSGNVGINTSSPAHKLTVAGRAFVDQFQYNQGIPISGVDLNDLSIAGFYAGSGLGNAPDSYGWYYVTVERHSDSSWVHQTATSYGAGNIGNRIYSRTKEAGTWTAWKELSYTSNISGTTNYVSKFTSSTTIGNSLIYDDGTNVGIGTTTPSGALHVATFGQYSYFSSNSGGASIADVQGLAIGWNKSAGGGETIIAYNKGGGATGGLAFSCNDGGSYAERMRITSGGNVGIGTSSPAAKLHVKESASSSSQIRMSAASSEANYGYLTMTDNTFNTARLTIGTTFGYNTPIDTITLFNGLVGIGTSNPALKLDINGASGSPNLAASSGMLKIGQTSVTGFLTIGAIAGSSYAGWIQMSDGGGSQFPLALQAAGGNVGIGITNPSFKLHVVGTAAIGQNTDGTAVIDAYFGNAYYGCNTATNGITINPSGYVGIGTTNPSYRLHVTGTAYINETLYVNGFTTVDDSLYVTGAFVDSNGQAGTSGQILSSTGSGTDWVDSPTSTATSVAQLLPSATVNYSWTGQVIDGTWVDIFTRANNILTSGVWTVTMYVSDFGQGGNHYQYRYSGTMTWYQGGTNQTGLPAASEIALHRMGHAANNCILYLRTTEEAASDGGNGKLQINANYSNTSNTTITFTFVKII